MRWLREKKPRSAWVPCTTLQHWRSLLVSCRERQSSGQPADLFDDVCLPSMSFKKAERIECFHITKTCSQAQR